MGKPATKEPPASSSKVEPGPSEQPADKEEDKLVIPVVDGQVAQEELEEETCGFCKFMKAGPCGTVFKVSLEPWLAPSLSRSSPVDSGTAKPSPQGLAGQGYFLRRGL